MGVFAAGQILAVDWRGDALPKEANKLRPCVVVEDSDLFDDAYPNVLLIPLTDDLACVIPALTVLIEPTKENGCAKRCYAVAHAVVTASKTRVHHATRSRVTDAQLQHIRELIAESLGLR